MVRKYPLKAPTSLLYAKGFLSTEPVSARWLESWLGKEQLQSSSAFLSLSLELQTDCLHDTCTVTKPENQKLRDANHLLPLVKPLQNKLLL
jgi:hypothetical protein